MFPGTIVSVETNTQPQPQPPQSNIKTSKHQTQKGSAPRQPHDNHIGSIQNPKPLLPQTTKFSRFHPDTPPKRTLTVCPDGPSVFVPIARRFSPTFFHFFWPLPLLSSNGLSPPFGWATSVFESHSRCFGIAD
jgi:hypothetical protein